MTRIDLTGSDASGETAFLLLGSNRPPREHFLQQAIELLGQLPDTHITWQSPVLRTPPYGYTQQEDFLNQVLHLKTGLLPRQLLRAVKETEQQVGRRESFRWGPREIDIDIIFYGNWMVQSPELMIPHGDYRNRDFVLKLLLEFDKGLKDPVTGEALRDRLQELERKTHEGLHEPGGQG
ncbi:2-amino-4-hydroxy-6-hydroxymethyldihydropteridine pyrophosphokinase [Desulfurispirillum indicum S5]|uniref:2-amino-4-hydroxy-6-hydroxymethyldihydropteridine pyrophosphokinase n=1 Tax=Desulfurispirillum indicum (strain ATCC BAA-1389 / DSM 22839 / S5) TaxID=653733 RepID=E6W044_DESIS|nr:2-amino-4-hydroxy-6-hydroxymethyldihydropteridine diphosphokinase [Desulfurispirillum indicum]ADU65170.1 2-amino-4-hydroxy-6-hydroxymethyldihydropteridine pyrophosphokinase [Desulfurispirillum indicum S5]